METLNYKVLAETGYNGYILKDAPVKVMQFGEGNFLRAFVDWQIDIANEKGVMDAGVAVCQPIIDPEHKVLGMIDLMHKQDNMYHVYLEGIENK